MMKSMHASEHTRVSFGPPYFMQDSNLCRIFVMLAAVLVSR